MSQLGIFLPLEQAEKLHDDTIWRLKLKAAREYARIRRVPHLVLTCPGANFGSEHWYMDDCCGQSFFNKATTVVRVMPDGGIRLLRHDHLPAGETATPAAKAELWWQKEDRMVRNQRAAIVKLHEEVRKLLEM